MPKLTINGREVEVEAGTTVIRAAEKLGVFVPSYCYHPGLTIAGNCRMCLVEIEKMPKLAISCSTLVADGMTVHTESPKVKEAQDAILEFLLINHPLDCPICDQAGECRLQEFAFQYGPAKSRFLEEKVHKPKNIDIGKHIMFDAERCILCSRCVRFCEEVPKTGELTIGQRADHAIIETYPGMRLDNAYSGNTVDICPVGALTLKEFRFRQRVWFIKDVPSVCPGCARGCSVDNGVSKGAILRITPRENQAVNRWWICDEGRLSYEKLYGPTRIASARMVAAAAGALANFATMAPGASARRAREPRPTVLESSPGEVAETPLIPIFNEGIPGAPRQPRKLGKDEVSMVAGLSAAARALGAALEAGGPGSVGFVLSPRATNEDLFVMGTLARDLFGARSVVLPLFERGQDDDILIRKDKSPNRRGASVIVEGLGLGFETEEALAQRLSAGQIRALVVLGPNLLGLETGAIEDANPLPGAEGRTGHGDGPAPQTAGHEELFARIVAAAGQSGALVVAIDAFESALTQGAGIVLPALTYGEIEGTFTNFEGHVQRILAGVAPAVDGLPIYRIAQEIGRALGRAPERAGARDAFAGLAAAIGPFAGLGYDQLGSGGAALR